MEKYLVIKDFVYFGEVLLGKDEEIIINNGIVNVKTSMGEISLNYDKIEDYLKKIEELDIKIEEFNEDIDEIKNFKLVLEFKTSKRKSIELEKFLRQSIPKYI
jgi:hypothetical protein